MTNSKLLKYLLNVCNFRRSSHFHPKMTSQMDLHNYFPDLKNFHGSISFQFRYPRILFLVGGAQCSDDCDNPEHRPTILCDFLNSDDSDIRLGECLRTFRKINLLLRQEHSLIFPPNLRMGYLTEDWAHLCGLWCIQSLLQHLLLDASFGWWLNEG